MWGLYLFFIKRKEKKTKYKKYMTELFPFIDWIKKIHVWKIENYMALSPSYKLPNNYMAICPSYNLPK